MYEKNRAADPQDVTMPTRASIIRARLGRTLAKNGSLGPARAECDQAVDLLQNAVADPTNINQRRLRVLAYTDLGDAYTTLASNHETPADAQLKDQRAARDMYQRGLDLMQGLRDRGILDADEVGEIENVGRKIAECDNILRSKP